VVLAPAISSTSGRLPPFSFFGTRTLFNELRSKIGRIVAKAANMRVNINLQSGICGGTQDSIRQKKHADRLQVNLGTTSSGIPEQKYRRKHDTTAKEFQSTTALAHVHGLLQSFYHHHFRDCCIPRIRNTFSSRPFSVAGVGVSGWCFACILSHLLREVLFTAFCFRLSLLYHHNIRCFPYIGEHLWSDHGHTFLEDQA
jgi:hypothetical protein